MYRGFKRSYIPPTTKLNQKFCGQGNEEPSISSRKVGGGVRPRSTYRSFLLSASFIRLIQ